MTVTDLHMIVQCYIGSSRQSMLVVYIHTYIDTIKVQVTNNVVWTVNLATWLLLDRCSTATD